MDKEQLLKLNKRIKDLEKELDLKKKEYRELKAKHLHLLARYQNLSNVVLLYKEGVENETNNNRTSKRRN